MGHYSLVAQTLVEYGAIAAALGGIQQRIEGYVGQGNLKYLMFALLGVLAFVWIWQKIR